MGSGFSSGQSRSFVMSHEAYSGVQRKKKVRSINLHRVQRTCQILWGEWHIVGALGLGQWRSAAEHRGRIPDAFLFARRGTVVGEQRHDGAVETVWVDHGGGLGTTVGLAAPGILDLGDSRSS